MPARIPTHRTLGQRAIATHRESPTRPSSNARGYTWRWRQYAKAYLQEHRTCVSCKAHGRYKAATEVDHVSPVQGPGDALFWEPSNHQALCSPCHKRKTATEINGQGLSLLKAGGPGQGGESEVRAVLPTTTPPAFKLRSRN